MNQYDSELIAGLLETAGYIQAESYETADFLLVNTCSVRHHAEDRALGRIRVLAGWKRKHPGRKLGVVGCMAQRLGSSWLKLCPDLDWVIGPDAYSHLPALLANGKKGPVVFIDQSEECYRGIHPVRPPAVHAWLAIMRGCDNFCSYCIVPMTRGRERSRPVGEILEEFQRIAEAGFREVTLLGQNVNAYRDGTTDFAGLLRLLHEAAPHLWIRFLTSHPKDLSPNLLEAVATCEGICPHIHLPVQTGSDRILAAMNRQYTRAQYLALVESIRHRIPEVSLTTDILVGFPGETSSDYQETLSLMEIVRFDDAFLYAYSPREGTPAATLKESLSQQEKRERLQRAIDLQRRISLEIKERMLGRRVEVLPIEPSKRDHSEWLSRTRTNQVVVIRGEDIRPGEPRWVRLETIQGATLRGTADTKKRG